MEEIQREVQRGREREREREGERKAERERERKTRIQSKHGKQGGRYFNKDKLEQQTHRTKETQKKKHL